MAPQRESVSNLWGHNQKGPVMKCVQPLKTGQAMKTSDPPRQYMFWVPHVCLGSPCHPILMTT